MQPNFRSVEGKIRQIQRTCNESVSGSVDSARRLQGIHDICSKTLHRMAPLFVFSGHPAPAIWSGKAIKLAARRLTPFQTTLFASLRFSANSYWIDPECRTQPVFSR
jgi:hypothetical protein